MKMPSFTLRNLLVICIILIFGYMALSAVPSDTTDVTSRLSRWFLSHASKRTNELLTDASNEIIPLLFAALFGGLGASLKQFVLFFDTDISVSSEGQSKLIREQPYSFVQLGMIMAIVGYLVLQSRFLIKLFYSFEIPPDSKLTFIGIAIAGVLCGFFSLELAGSSRRMISSKLAAAEKGKSQ